VALTAALLLGGQAIARQIRFERAERAAWRAAGASPRSALLAALTPIAAVVAVGAALSVLVALAASPLMPIGSVRRVEVAPGIDADWAVLGFGALLLIVGLMAVGALVGRREAPHRRAQRPAATSRSPVVAAAGRVGVAPSTMAGLRLAFEPGEGPTAVPVRSVIASVAVAVAALAAAVTFGSSLSALVAHPARYGWDWGATIWAGAGYGNVDGKATARILDRDPHVQAWSQAWFGSALVDRRNLPLLGMDPASAVTPPIESGRSIESAQEVVLGTATINALHKHIGDSVDLGDAHKTHRLKIVGTAIFPTIGVVHGEHTSLGVGALVAPQLVPGYGRNLFELDNAGGNTVFVRFEPGTNAVAELASLNKYQPDFGGGYQDVSVAAVHRPAEIVNARDAGSAPALLAGALVLASAISLAVALRSSVRRRRRDLAVLKSLGFTRRQIASAVAWQATATSVVAVVVGVPVGIFVGWWAWIVFARQLDVVARPEIPLLTVGALAIAVVLVANAIAALPARLARSVQPAALLREE
jgi:hypothetical protein